MKHKLFAVVLPVAVALVANSANAARYYTFSGVGCESTSNQNCVDRGQYGINNTCPSPVSVECPVNVMTASSGAPTVSSFSFVGYDRSDASDLECDIQRVDALGNIGYTAHLKTAGNQIPSQNPIVTPGGGVGVLGYWRLRCTLPAPSANASHLTSFTMATTQE